MKNEHCLLGAAVCVAIVALSAFSCSSDFESCQDSRTCPKEDAGVGGASGTGGKAGSGTGATSSGGAAGAAGEAGAAGQAGDSGAAGAAGAPPTPECTDDLDCADELACNGVETCVSGSCAAGTPVVCQNPDSAHCAVACVEIDGGSECRVSGLDGDNDGHTALACAAAPGDDCDDTLAGVKPGAVELCDRIDNDCDALIDLADGLPLSGTSTQVGDIASLSRSNATVAWSPTSSVYGLLWIDRAQSTLGDLRYTVVDQSGVFTGTPVVMGGAGNTLTPARVGLSWGGDAFGLARYTVGTMATLSYVRVSTGGTTLTTGNQFFTPQRGAYSGVMVTHAGDGTAGLLWEHCDQGGCSLWGRSVSAAGALGAETQFVTADGGPYQAEALQLAGTPSGFVVAYDEDNLAKARILTTSLATTLPLTLVGRRPVVGAGAGGFAIAVAGATAEERPKITMYGLDGAVQCGPVDFADAGFAPDAVVASELGYIVASRGRLRAQEIGLGCSLGPAFDIDASIASGVRMARGSAGFAIVWQDTSLGVPKMRLFGKNLCD